MKKKIGLFSICLLLLITTACSLGNTPTSAVEKLLSKYNNQDEEIVVELDDYILLTNNASYFTIVGELFKKPKYHRANFKASFNDYHEIVIEEYSEDNMKEKDFNNDEEIIIK